MKWLVRICFLLILVGLWGLHIGHWAVELGERVMVFPGFSGFTGHGWMNWMTLLIAVCAFIMLLAFERMRRQLGPLA